VFKLTFFYASQRPTSHRTRLSAFLLSSFSGFFPLTRAAVPRATRIRSGPRKGRRPKVLRHSATNIRDAAVPVPAVHKSYKNCACRRTQRKKKLQPRWPAAKEKQKNRAKSGWPTVGGQSFGQKQKKIAPAAPTVFSKNFAPAAPFWKSFRLRRHFGNAAPTPAAPTPERRELERQIDALTAMMANTDPHDVWGTEAIEKLGF